MDHVAFSKRGHNIGGDEIQNHVSEGGFHLGELGAQIEGAQIHAYAGLEDHAARNAYHRGNHRGAHIDQQDLGADPSHLLDIRGGGDAHDQGCKHKGNDGHFDEVQIAVAYNVEHRADEEIIAHGSRGHKTQNAADDQTGNQTDDGLFSQGHCFFAFFRFHLFSPFLNLI